MLDRTKLPWEKSNAVECWQVFPARATCNISWQNPVERVWATNSSIYTTKPDGKGYMGGRRSSRPLYATEAEAWEACLTEFREWFDERMKKLEDMAAKAKAKGGAS